MLLLSPVLLGIIISLFFINNGKVFFKQKRIGFKNQVFYILKFRTMLENGSDDVIIEEDLASLTPFGFFLRKYSLDELPQLINIIKGEMSFIGPRPLLTEYLTLYTPSQLKRHNVKPGITGWAQVNGRNNTTWGKRFDFDLEYVTQISLLFDIKICVFTLKHLFVKPDGEQLIEKFKGNN
jgi:undecaprenyl phosphate N,N'-diacetylbacillosamine 1-phosphate transferase